MSDQSLIVYIIYEYFKNKSWKNELDTNIIILYGSFMWKKNDLWVWNLKIALIFM